MVPIKNPQIHKFIKLHKKVMSLRRLLLFKKKICPHMCSKSAKKCWKMKIESIFIRKCYKKIYLKSHKNHTATNIRRIPIPSACTKVNVTVKFHIAIAKPHHSHESFHNFKSIEKEFRDDNISEFVCILFYFPAIRKSKYCIDDIISR